MSQENNTKSLVASFRSVDVLKRADFIENLLNIIDEVKGEYYIEGYSYSFANKPRYKEILRDRLVKEILDKEDENSLMMVRIGGRKSPLFNLEIKSGTQEITRGRYDLSIVTIQINHDYFIDKTLNDNKLRSFLAFCKKIYYMTNALCGFVHDAIDNNALAVSLGKRGMFSLFGLTHSIEVGHIKQPHIDCPLNGISWANYFGPKCVQYFGEELLTKSVGVYDYERLNNGGLLIKTAPHPFSPDDKEHRQNQISYWKSLRLEPIPNLKILRKYKKDNWEDVPIFTTIQD